MNVIARQPRAQADLDAELSPFLSAEQPSLRPVTDGLRDRGWLTGDELLTLAPPGEPRARRHSGRVTVTRARVTEGISAEEYRATVDVLALMSGEHGRLTSPNGMTSGQDVAGGSWCSCSHAPA